MSTGTIQPCFNRLYPLAYLLTFSCYGDRLHGDQRLSVDRNHNQFNTPFVEPNPSLFEAESSRMRNTPYSLDLKRRQVVGESFRGICEERNWELISFHVRKRHLHLVLSAAMDPESILIDLKRKASRELNRAGFDKESNRRWARGGSKRYLWTPESVATTVDYVLNHQGKPMESYLADTKWLGKSQ